LVIAFSLSVFTAQSVGYEGRGKSRSAEKSKGRTFPLRLEIPQRQRDFHFSHRPGYGGIFPLTQREISRQDRLGTTIANSVEP
jgi:hypothetical protein